jgi:glycosyltransferase involved in cell wall biosynthesis
MVLANPQALPLGNPDLSVVAPLYNESENVRPLVDWILQALEAYSGVFEVLLVDDGSRDQTWSEIRAAAAADPRVMGLRLGRNVGQTAAMMAGFDNARGRVIVSLDGDLQNDPRDIPALIAKLDEGYDLVCGWRRQRQDKLLLRKIPSWVANRLIRRLTGVPITDNGCSLKAYRRDLLNRISLYAEQHRFIPALSASVGARITEMPVRHHARRFGESKYGISRTVKVLVDLQIPAAGGLCAGRGAGRGGRGRIRCHVGIQSHSLRSGQGRCAGISRSGASERRGCPLSLHARLGSRSRAQQRANRH